MSRSMFGIGRLAVLTGCLVLAGNLASTSAGPARYDPETKSFKFTYTFAALTDGLFGDDAIGAPQKPSTDQDAIVRTVVLKVSDALSQATAGRAKILSLDFVPDVKRADIVISLTSKPSRGGWAIAGAIEGRPGQIGLYYQTLADELEQDYVLTAAHEISHYLFGLVDEYNFPQGCPVANPGGPGCLMDNYLSNGSRHGWYGRYCRDDHATDPTQKQSCQAIVDDFFKVRNIGPATDDPKATTPAGSVTPAAAASSTTSRQTVIDNLTRATIGKVREEAEARIKDKKGTLTSILDSGLKDVAKKFLASQLKLNQVSMTDPEVGNLADGVLKQVATLVKVAIPPRFDPIVNIIAKFAEARVKELKEKSPKDSETTRKTKVREALLTFVAGLGSNAPTVDGPLTPEERRYLEFVAMQAIAKSNGQKANDELLEATMAHIKLSRETASNVLDMAGEVGVVGIENRLAALGDVDKDLRKFLPGKTASSGFGRRRTIVIDPDPLDPKFDYIVTQSGIFRYAEARGQFLAIFQKLVERAQLEVLTTEVQKRRQKEQRDELLKTTLQRLGDERRNRIANLTDPGRVRGQREADLRALINELISEVRRNRLENIVFMVPPGGIPKDMGPVFETLRRQLIIKTDVRLDVILTGAATMPFELRDISVGTGGSIVTLADFDEVGAVAQRLKNDQAFGCWITLPQQDDIRGPYFDLTGGDNIKGPRWLLDDPKREKPQTDKKPFDRAYNRVKSGLISSSLYLTSRAKANLISPDGKPTPPSNWDPVPTKTNRVAAVDAQLTNAQVLSIRAREELVKMFDELLWGAKDGNNPEDSRSGLAEEIIKINSCVLEFNQRKPGSDDSIRFELIDHVLRARTLYEELRFGLVRTLAAHEPFLSPDYDEDELFQKGYNTTLDDLNRLKKLTGTQASDLGTLASARSQPPPRLATPAPITTASVKSPTVTNPQPGAAPPDQTNLTPGATTPAGAPASNPAEPKPQPDATPPGAPASNPAESKPQPNSTPPGAPASNPAESKPQPNSTPPTQTNLPGSKQQPVLLPTGDPGPQDAAKTKTPTVAKTPQEIVDDLERDMSNNELQTFHLLTLLEKEAQSYEKMKATFAYINLKRCEVELRLVDDFLDQLERELAGFDKAALFKRIDRRGLVQAVQKMHDMAPGYIPRVPGQILQPPIPPFDTNKIVDGNPIANPAIRLPRFYAENQRFDPTQKQAEFEMIVGFSQPLPGVDVDAIRDNKRELLPELRLYNDNGLPVETPSLALDRDASTPTCLIYRFSPEFGETGWYTAALRLKDKTLRYLNRNKINYTFSIASTRPNFRLTAAQMQMPDDPELVPPPPRRGLARAMDRRVRVEVQVYGGTSVLNASLRGIMYKLDEGTQPIVPVAQDFHDDGKTYGDRVKDDGIYTTLIGLDQVETDKEYRLLIQADSTPASKNIAPEDPGKNDLDRRQQAIKLGKKDVRPAPTEKVETPKSEDAVVFQRATSIQIRVQQ